jgi:hypothetical protein
VASPETQRAALDSNHDLDLALDLDLDFDRELDSPTSSLEWAFLRVDFHISRPCLDGLGPFHLAKIKMGGSLNLPGYLDQYPFCQKKF